MDFALRDDQKAVAELAAKIFQDRLTGDVRKALDKATDPFDDVLWARLADAGLLGVALRDDIGGAGHGFLEHCALLAAAGAAAAPVPLWAVATTALAIDRFGSAELRKALLPEVVRGKALVSMALAEPDGGDPRAPATEAHRDGDGWRLRGTKTCVPAALRAAQLLVPARTGDGGVVLLLVDPTTAGVIVTRQVATSGEIQGLITFSDTRVEDSVRLGELDDGPANLGWLLDHATVGLCALELGVTEQVLRMTASYTAQRVQFDRPVATFQAVAQRAADAYIDVESIRLTLWEAAWQLSEGRPATREIAIAKFFAADAGPRITYAAQHLHGGMGYDLDYPLARYYPLSKQIELTLGSASVQLARLGALLAE